MILAIPGCSLVALVGPSGSGKSTFARRHFKLTEVLSSDFFRGLVSDDEANQGASRDAFAVLHFVTAKRLAASRLTVIDATNVQPEARQALVALARQYHCPLVAVVFNLPPQLCEERDRLRTDRRVGPAVIQQQYQNLCRSLATLEREGFHYVYILSTPEEIDAAVVVRQPPAPSSVEVRFDARSAASSPQRQRKD
jgi:protein phosphatase